MTAPPLPGIQDATPAEKNELTAGRLKSLVSWLRKRASYPQAAKHVAVIETHISWLFLTDQFVYKLKKPVRFEFLDFSTPEFRRAACLEEVRLNRRLAPDVYLEVVPVLQDSPGRFRLGGRQSKAGAGGLESTPGGERAIDWLVKMRRLPADRALDRLIRDKKIDASDLDNLAEYLAYFYTALPPLTVKTEDYRRKIKSHVLANRQDLLGALPEDWSLRVARVHDAQLRFLYLADDLLNTRVLNGRIVDGHGDLRPEHIYLCQRPTIIDCIEFSQDLRQIDVLDELAFLCMECDLLGDTHIGRFLLERYRQNCGDDFPTSLLSFYQCYRACVRAKVHALRASQLGCVPNEDGGPNETGLAEVKRYLGLADHYAALLGPPCLIVVHGLSGTGKSTLAKAISDSLAMTLLQTDVLRGELFSPTDAAPGYSQGRYAAEQREQVYLLMLQRAEELLQKGCSVVLDGSFLSTQTRQAAALLAQRFKAFPLFLRCACPLPVARQRVVERRKKGERESEIVSGWLELQRQADEPDPTNLHVVTLDTTRPSLELLEVVCKYLRDSGWASTNSPADQPKKVF